MTEIMTKYDTHCYIHCNKVEDTVANLICITHYYDIPGVRESHLVQQVTTGFSDSGGSG